MPAASVADALSPWAFLPTLLRLALTVGCGVFVGLEREHHTLAPKLNLEQPFSLSAALKFGLIFLALHVAGTLDQRQLGTFEFYA